MSAVVRNKMIPIFCLGETAHERRQGETKQVLHDQTVVGLKHLTSNEVAGMVIAYEPVWAIGTGDFAKPDSVKEAAETIRHNIAELYGRRAANRVRVLYGGSVEPDLVKGYMAIDGIDGLLVGHESLNYAHFASIVKKIRETADDAKQ